MGAKTTTVAMYASDRDLILSWMKAGQTLRDKIHELVLKEERLKGGNKNNVRKKETGEKD